MKQRQLTNQPPYTEASIKASSPKAQTNIEMLNHAKQFIDSASAYLLAPFQLFNLRLEAPIIIIYLFKLIQEPV